MTRRYRQNAKAIRNMFGSALAVALATGCAQPGHIASTSQASAKSESALDNAVAKAEQAVAKNPMDAAARAELAHVYLRTGRFESAVTSFEDAVQLGDTSPRTALSLALAKVGAGHHGEAVALLDQHRDAIPASDYGLALALAGETGRGVAILGDALREGEDTPKLRQNLAYAYALDGRWREARLMAAQDVPADQLDARISSWAMAGKPEDYRKRVAGLLGAPVRDDFGQPEYLALNPGPQPVQVAAVAEEAPAAPQQDAELPPIASFGQIAAADPMPSDEFEAAFGKVDTTSAQRYIFQPVVQSVPERSAWSRPVAAAAPAPVAASAGGSTHLVQLGSFRSEEGARRAWKIYVSRNPELKGHVLTITRAEVGGKLYWRVSAAGFNRRSAASMCSSVKGRGGGCIAYAASRPLPGALPARGSAPQMARN